MSWLERINTEYKIRTGDTSEYYPLWFNAKKAAEYNFTEFLFPNVKGSLVIRNQPKGARYNVEIVFQGSDCIDVGNAFIKSAENSNPWTVAHPYYGIISVQPIGLELDNSVLNVSKVTGTVIETIGFKLQNVTVSAPDIINQQAYAVSQDFGASYAQYVPDPSVSDLQRLTYQVNQMYAAISDQISDATDANNFLNAYNQANVLINNTVFDTYALIAQVQQVALLPATFVNTSVNRVALLIEQLESLYSATLVDAVSSVKKAYENNAATSICACCIASITQYDYKNRGQVIGVIEAILDGYNQYIVNLDALQSLNGALIDSYIPYPTGLTDLAYIVNYTISTLYDIATQTKQERTIYLPEDTTIVQAVYKYYGLTEDDSTITQFIDVNSIGLNEMFILAKGRKIIYYM